MTPRNVRQTVRLAVVVGGMGAALANSACSGKPSDTLVIVEAGGGTSSLAGSGASASNGPSELDLGGTSSTPLGTGGLAATDACATDTLKAERSPVNMFIQFDRSGSMNESDKCIQALNAIRGAVISCDVALPTGDNVDTDKVNVQLTPSGASPEVIGQATGPDNCAAGGWHYDNPAAPQRISFCPSTCQRVQADSGAQVDIVLGCEGVKVK